MRQQGVLTLELMWTNKAHYSRCCDGEVFRSRCDFMESSWGGMSFSWLILMDFLRNPKSSFLLFKIAWGKPHWLQWQLEEREQVLLIYILSWKLAVVWGSRTLPNLIMGERWERKSTVTLMKVKETGVLISGRRAGASFIIGWEGPGDGGRD